jgi:hypothetical protein
MPTASDAVDFLEGERPVLQHILRKARGTTEHRGLAAPQQRQVKILSAVVVT